MKQWAGLSASARAVALRPRIENGRGGTRGRGSRNAADPQQKGVASSVAEDALLLSTAKLALSTARQVRQLSAVVTQCVAIPDGSRFAEGFKVIAQRDLPWMEDAQLHTWALIMATILDSGEEGQAADDLRVVRAHQESAVSAAMLRGHVLDCQASRTWSGDCTNLRFAVSTELREVAQCVSRLLVAGGGRIRYGAAPRGPLERAVASSLLAHVGAAGTRRAITS